MKKLKSLYHFLGGIHFALILIMLAIATVVAGTFLESKTGSHLLAARWTYEHPFFQFILVLFFINILFSALRRWPFKIKHIPFLITHIGLLMIISGSILKNRFGLQGQMSVWEGSGNQHVLLPQTYAVNIEGKEPSLSSTKNSLTSLASFQPNIFYPFHFPDLKCKLIGYAKHVKDKSEAWIKEDKAYISGFPPLAVKTWESSQPFPDGSIHRRTIGSFLSWLTQILRTEKLQEAKLKAYLQGLNLQIKVKDGKFKPFEISLQNALKEPFPYADGFFYTSLHLPFPPFESEEIPKLELNWKNEQGNENESISISLHGQGALIVQSDSPHVLETRFSVDLLRPNHALCLVEGEDNNITFLVFDIYGRIYEESFSPSNLKTVISYDQGFGGYSVQAVFPIPSFPAGREDKERAEVFELTEQFRQALVAQPSLIPPLLFFEDACKLANIDFSSTFIQFLAEWKATPELLFSPLGPLSPQLDTVLEHLDWKNISNNDLQAALWTNKLFKQLEAQIKNGDDIIRILESHHWPLLSEFKEQTSEFQQSPLNLLAQQISTLIPYLPALDFTSPVSKADRAILLSAFFRVYGIDYRSLRPPQKGNKEQFDSLEAYWNAQTNPNSIKAQQVITFETPLTSRIIPESAPEKLEDQRAGIVLEVQQGQKKQIIALAYDTTGTGMKWPILNGNFLVRFQPDLKKLPYRIRLRQARQILYPQSSQVYSYESDLLISENGRDPIEQTLSMNHVYETWDGYRFYLSGIGTSNDASLKRIQLAVNHDPAKYYLTYPGGALVFAGIIMLFWILPHYKKQ